MNSTRSNPEAERSVLGCLMLSADAFDDIAGMITADDFLNENHARVFQICEELHAAGKPVDA